MNLEEEIMKILNKNKFLNNLEKKQISLELMRLINKYIAEENLQKPF